MPIILAKIPVFNHSGARFTIRIWFKHQSWTLLKAHPTNPAFDCYSNRQHDREVPSSLFSLPDDVVRKARRRQQNMTDD
ncbi:MULTISPECIES: hypothetical protein [Microcoleaceae]|uniref:hypothetical protein n=1 Tax=Microcoleaceae TaxID=1892252 RepID=UPI001882A3F8|nr:hypothetical protein [Tychonema sp. LEGE 06208]MBE9162095.1 hypothetical protein [Tychonema sp. LEGE 06208]